MKMAEITYEHWSELVGRVDALERLTNQLRPLGPNPKQEEELERRRESVAQEIIDKVKNRRATKDAFELPPPPSIPPPPVDRSAQILVSGDPVPEDRSHATIRPDTGMQRDYIILTPEERGKGFVRPVRRSYKHLECGSITTMATSIAETFARDPGFYGGGYCARCKGHFPNKEFVWPDDGTEVGS